MARHARLVRAAAGALVLLAAVAAPALAARPAPDQPTVLRGTMIRAIDGNLVHVKVKGHSTAVRLVGVAPTAAGTGLRGTCLTEQARVVVERIVPPGSAVRVETDPGRRVRDAGGAVVGYLYKAKGPRGTASVNRALLATGLARYQRAGDLRFGGSLRGAEARARKANLGRWGDACSLATTKGVQKRLVALGYLPAGHVNGSMDYRTTQAVMAFQGWSGLARDGAVGPATRKALARAERPEASQRGGGRHVEIHIGRQVLLMVEGGTVKRAIHVSTGAAGNTPRGRWTVIRREAMSYSVPFNSWMPYAMYFVGGFAMHEYPDVPGYPASHGCVRMPAPEAPVVWDFAGYGTPVIVA
jgi:endonuclease YncB( thermonuclease family)